MRTIDRVVREKKIPVEVLDKIKYKNSVAGLMFPSNMKKEYEGVKHFQSLKYS